MPSADADLQQRMFDRFGSHTDEEGPIKFLEDAGYKLTRQYLWEPKTGVTCLKDMTRDEFDCMLFLVHEWDYGGLVGDE